MIKTYQVLMEELKEYKNPKTKIQRMVSKKEIFYITKGLYETNLNVNPYFLADPIYSPSYISFETALSYYELIPEKVYAIKSATFNKRKKKEFKTNFGVFTYRDVPSGVFAYGVDIIFVDGYTYKIAKKEKALLDQLYVAPKMSNKKEIREYLFENLRINEMVLDTFDKKIVSELSCLYHSKNVELFEQMIRKDKLYD